MSLIRVALFGIAFMIVSFLFTWLLINNPNYSFLLFGLAFGVGTIYGTIQTAILARKQIDDAMREFNDHGQS
jgi:hypothetical protein